MKIRRKLTLAHTAMAAMAIAMFASFALMTDHLREEFERIIELSSQTVGALTDIQLSGERIAASTDELILLSRLGNAVNERSVPKTSNQYRERYFDRNERQIQQNIGELRKALKRYSDLVEAHFPHEIDTRNSIESSARGLISMSLKTIEENKPTPNGLVVLNNTHKLEMLEGIFFQTIDMALRGEEKEWLEARKHTKSDVTMNRYVSVISGGIIVISVLLIGWLVSRNITRPVGELVLATGRIGRGEFDAPLEIDSRDEIGELATSFREMTGKLVEMRRDLEDQIDERKRAQNRLNQQAVELKNSNAELEQFAYVASHDLQEPLRKIRAFGDRLQSKCGDTLDEQGRDYVTRMQSAAGRMQKLIESLLTFSRVSSNKQPLVPVDLNEVSQEVISDLETRIQESGGTVRILDLPTLDADPIQIHQLLQNLIGNGIKYRHEDTAPVIEVSAEITAHGGVAGGSSCRIQVRDNGIGFDPEFADQIFGIFQRLHGRGEYEGTGVGLAICRKIAERHGGTISAEGRPGEGATFTVVLPLRQVREAA